MLGPDFSPFKMLGRPEAKAKQRGLKMRDSVGLPALKDKFFGAIWLVVSSNARQCRRQISRQLTTTSTAKHRNGSHFVRSRWIAAVDSAHKSK